MWCPTHERIKYLLIGLLKNLIYNELYYAHPMYNPKYAYLIFSLNFKCTKVINI